MTPSIVSGLGRVALMVVAIGVVTRQCRKPSWWPGRLSLWDMNRRHADVTNWGLEHVAIAKDFTILDVGCGGGETINTLATMASEGRVYGIDYSAESVASSRRRNRSAIEAGRVDVRQASVSHLPFPDETFDVVTAVETHYYWPDPVADMREVRRVLNPGGRFVVIAETYKGRRLDALYRPAMKLLRATYLTVDEHKELLSAAGYLDVATFLKPEKGWICVLGTKPT
jgi:ubiquinone/menaquinone biosynthesis C-methylase UbiE